MSSLFRKDIKLLKGVGERRAKLFNRLDVYSIGELISFYPRTYEDWSNQFSVTDAPTDVICCIKGIVSSYVTEDRVRKNLVIYKFKICDEMSFIEVVFFNTPFIKRQLDKGEKILIRGTPKIKNGRKQIVAPAIMNDKNYFKIKPVYPQTEGLSNNQILSAVKQALSMLPGKINDPINESVRTKYNLCDLEFAIRNIHFPSDLKSLEIAKRRITFEEILVLQVGMTLYKYKNSEFSFLHIVNDFTEEFFDLLPFELTSAQKRVIWECNQDMKDGNKTCPMSRLIQGDVGSGKTAVCAALCYNVVKNKGQVALMTPTEILSKQHYKWFKQIFQNTGINIALLTGTVTKSEKMLILESLNNGKIDIVIGTHALISDSVEFSNLALDITHEQHRVGVAQRSKLIKKGQAPHMLVMSATPIPRTLALIIYGDLDISVIDELPAGRKCIDTFYVTSEKRKRVFNFIKSLIDNGQQGYIVCPLIEDSENGLVAVETYAENVLKETLNECKVGILHGRMNNKDKSLVMEKFLSGELDLIISTTVVEVGVDVPNAAFILIENAERFGLAQLHQLRGRVGRGDKKSYCILLSDSKSEETLKRLKIMVSTTDGFEIADEDLKLRGPGDFIGNRQHGIPEIKNLEWMCNTELIKEAKSASKLILEADPELELLENKVLLAKVKFLFRDMWTNFN